MKLGIYLHGTSPFNPVTSFQEYKNRALNYENQGFDSLWFADHLIRTPDPDQGPVYETWTLMSALGAITSKIKFGTLVTPITFRNFGVFMKMITTFDHITNGRLITGLGIGWYQKEHSMFGLEFKSVKERFDILETTLDAYSKLCNGETVNNEKLGLVQAYLNPLPIQKPLPILIGGSGEKKTFRLIAKYAQMSNFGGTNEQLKRKLQVLQDRCSEIGRDFSEVITTSNRALITARTKQELSSSITNYKKRLNKPNMTTDEFKSNRLVGFPSEVAEQIRELEEIGIKYVTFTINDPISQELAGDVLREVK
ncbi:MAG: LLM class flavin-dependent oxidoreductase [Promethearchaeota archaeon]